MLFTNNKVRAHVSKAEMSFRDVPSFTDPAAACNEPNTELQPCPKHSRALCAKSQSMTQDWAVSDTACPPQLSKRKRSAALQHTLVKINVARCRAFCRPFRSNKTNGVCTIIRHCDGRSGSGVCTEHLDCSCDACMLSRNRARCSAAT